MKKGLLLQAIFALFLFSSISLFAQESRDDVDFDLNPLTLRKDPLKLYIGPVFGFNQVSHNLEYQSFSVKEADKQYCPKFNSGSDAGYFFGISMEYLLGDVKNSTSSIIGRVLYNVMPGTMTVANTVLPVRDKVTGAEVDYQTENELTADYSAITGELMYKFNFAQGLGLAVGPTFDFAMASTREQRLNILKPDNVQFVEADLEASGYSVVRYENDHRTIVVYDDDIPGGSAFRLGLKFGLQYEYSMKGLYVVPGVFYNYGITKLSSDTDWRVHTLQAQIDIRFVL
jgi:hypothetical protein